jgi:hypothetical protein
MANAKYCLKNNPFAEDLHIFHSERKFGNSAKTSKKNEVKKRMAQEDFHCFRI